MSEADNYDLQIMEAKGKQVQQHRSTVNLFNIPILGLFAVCIDI